MMFIAFKGFVWSLLAVTTLILSLVSSTAADSGTAVSPVLDCELYDDLYICTGAQHRMHCNITKHHFSYQRNQHQHQYQCLSNDCVCVGNNDTCVCYSNTSSCFCETFNNTTVTTADSPVSECVHYNDLYICTGSQHHMYCNTSVQDFHYDRSHHHCLNNYCNCIGYMDTCTCSNSTQSSCFCEMNNVSISVPAGLSPVYECVLYNDTYICTGAQYRMFCNTRLHYFRYKKNQFECWSNECYCFADEDTCTCYGSTLSSCFCENYNTTIPTNVNALSSTQCRLYNDKLICTGAQYRMHCNTTTHDFYYQRYQNQDQYQCINNYCNCIGNKDTCTCYSSTWSSCFCETCGNAAALTTAVSPVYDCVLYNNLYICTGAHYHMYCNTNVHDFHYNKYHKHCLNNCCDCIGDANTCTCWRSTLSSCFCEMNNVNISVPAAVSPVSDCVLYKDTYICTGAQYRMYCNTSMHSFLNQRYRHQDQLQYCSSNNCNCTGNKDTCTCYSSTWSSCFCETYGNITALTTAVSPVYDCVLYKDTYICTGAQYHMYCNTSVHDFHYKRDHHHCWNKNCTCIGNKTTCSCSSTAPSSCYCTDYRTNIPILALASPVSDCVLYSDTYVCTGAQYRMFCNTSAYDFQKYINQNQNKYTCLGDNCNCIGNGDTCTCLSSTLSSCFCETYNGSIALDTAVGPVSDCVLYNNSLICTSTDQCRCQTSGGCHKSLLEQIDDNTDLPLTTVTNILTAVFNATEKILDSPSSANQAELASYGNTVLKTSEKLISTLVKPTNTSASVSFSLTAVDVKIFMVGPLVTLDEIPRLDTTDSSMDIDLIGIANNNYGSAAVTILSYTTMQNLLKPDFFNPQNNMIKTMMSSVISATLPKTTNTALTKPVNFTFRHIREFDPRGFLSCVYWNISEWIVDGCSVVNTNGSHTVCSCVHLSTFALVQSSRPSFEINSVNLAFVIIGLSSSILILSIFGLCCWSPLQDRICGHSSCIRLIPKGYSREELSSTTQSASDVFTLNSNPTEASTTIKYETNEAK